MYEDTVIVPFDRKIQASKEPKRYTCRLKQKLTSLPESYLVNKNYTGWMFGRHQTLYVSGYHGSQSESYGRMLSACTGARYLDIEQIINSTFGKYYTPEDMAVNGHAFIDKYIGWQGAPPDTAYVIAGPRLMDLIHLRESAQDPWFLSLDRNPMGTLTRLFRDPHKTLEEIRMNRVWSRVLKGVDIYGHKFSTTP